MFSLKVSAIAAVRQVGVSEWEVLRARACAVHLLEKAAASGALREIEIASIGLADEHRRRAMACALVRLSVKIEVNGETSMPS